MLSIKQMIIAETERLIITKMSTDDAPFYLQLVNTPSWIKYIGDRGITTLDAAAQKIDEAIIKSYKDHGFGTYKLLLKEDNNRVVGSCGIYKRPIFKHPDIGFAMLEDSEGKGYGYEASIALLKYAKKEFKLKKIFAIVLPTNQKSIKLLEKLGLKYVKTAVFFEDDEELMLFAKKL